MSKFDEATPYEQLVAVNQMIRKVRDNLHEWVIKGDFSAESLKRNGLYGVVKHPSEEYTTDLEISCTNMEEQAEKLSDLVEMVVAQAKKNVDVMS